MSFVNPSRATLVDASYRLQLQLLDVCEFVGFAKIEMQSNTLTYTSLPHQIFTLAVGASLDLEYGLFRSHLSCTPSLGHQKPRLDKQNTLARSLPPLPAGKLTANTMSHFRGPSGQHAAARGPFAFPRCTLRNEGGCDYVALTCPCSCAVSGVRCPVS